MDEYRYADWEQEEYIEQSDEEIESYLDIKQRTIDILKEIG